MHIAALLFMRCLAIESTNNKLNHTHKYFKHCSLLIMFIFEAYLYNHSKSIADVPVVQYMHGQICWIYKRFHKCFFYDERRRIDFPLSFDMYRNCSVWNEWMDLTYKNVSENKTKFLLFARTLAYIYNEHQQQSECNQHMHNIYNHKAS